MNVYVKRQACKVTLLKAFGRDSLFLKIRDGPKEMLRMEEYEMFLWGHL